MHELRQQFLQFLKYCETVLRDENAAGAVKETVSAWVKLPVYPQLCSGGCVLCSVVVGVSSTVQWWVFLLQCNGGCVLCSVRSGGCVLCSVRSGGCVLCT